MACGLVVEISVSGSTKLDQQISACGGDQACDKGGNLRERERERERDLIENMSLRD